MSRHMCIDAVMALSMSSTTEKKKDSHARGHLEQRVILTWRVGRVRGESDEVFLDAIMTKELTRVNLPDSTFVQDVTEHLDTTHSPHSLTSQVMS